jgi:cobalt-zinc-cadmium efflux system membrane fusion protein
VSVPVGPVSHGAERLSGRRQLTLLGAGALALLLVTALLMLAGRPRAHAQTHEADAAGLFQPSPEQWAGFEVEPVRSLPFRDQQDTDGKIGVNDNRTAPVYSPFTGRVTKVLVEAGQLVRKGQPMFAVQAAEYVQAQSDIGAARSAEDTARAQLATAQADEGRLHELYKADGASLKDWQQSQLALETAKANLRSADVAMAAVKNRLLTMGEDGGKLAALEAGASAHRINPEAVVYAPMAGTVVTRQVEPGQFVTSQSSGQATPAFTVSDLSSVWLVANVREADAGRVHLGDVMSVRALAYPERLFQARITFIAPALDPATRRLAVRAEIANPDGLLKPEMFADFDITTGQASSAMAIPEAAVIYEGQSAHVWLATPDRRLQLQQVRLGRSAHGFVEVLDGLKAGDRIATSGALFIDRAARAG